MTPNDNEIEKFANLIVADPNLDSLPKDVAIKRSAIQAAKWARDQKRPWMTEISDILYDAGFSPREKVTELHKILEYHFG